MKKLPLDELNLLANFNFARSAWSSEDTQTIRVTYDDEYNDFEVITSEKNVRKGRITKLQAEIMSWADNQIKTLSFQGKTVTVLNFVFENGEVGIELAFASNTSDIPPDEMVAS